MTSRFGVIAFAVVIAVGPIGAEWKENGKTVPDKPWMKSDGGFGAQLVLTDKPEELFAAWQKPGPAVIYSDSVVARRGLPIVAVVFFAGCAPNERGFCEANVRFTAYGPDGKPYGQPQKGELWTGKPPPPEGRVQMSVGNMGIVIEPKDALGAYRVEAEVVDWVVEKRMVLERTFTAIETETK